MSQKKLLSCLKDCVENPNEPDSPRLEVMGGRGTLYGIIHKEENGRKLSSFRTEIATNEKILIEIYEDCLTNTELRSKNKANECHFTNLSLALSSTESLYVNKYLIVDEDFYDCLLAYRKSAKVLNKYPVEFEKEKGETVEKYLISPHQILTKYFDELKRKLEKIES